ncbi:MAG: response regulator transcription factor [Nonomuraea sp.]|nr:response regulator transcription factor [Nonomuraea sp.]
MPENDSAEDRRRGSTVHDVLLVEGDELIREATQLTLEEHGYRVRTAADGVTGPALLRKRRPDVAVLDIMLPGLNGVRSLAGRIGEESGVPVLLISARNDPVDGVLSRDLLLERVWDYAWSGDTRVVDVHVQRLRSKTSRDRIETVRGFGYKLRP